MKRLSAIIIVMMLIVAIPTESFAVSKPSQVKNLKASAKTTSSITLKWSKVKGAKGYEVQQYNSKSKKWKTLKKVKVLNYKHTKLKANTLYKYRVRAYKTYKQYYNSKTKKWQNKKPAKKNWKNKKTRTKYVYGKVSKTLSVRTKKKTTTNNTGSGNTPSSSPTSTSDGSTTEAMIDYSDYTDNDARLNLRVTKAANRSVTLVWDALQGAKHYTVKAGDSITTTESTSITLNNLTKNKSTLFEVQAEKYKNGKLYCFSNSCSVSVRFYDDYYTESGFHYDNEVHIWTDYYSEKNMIDIPKKGTYTAKDYKGKETIYDVVEGGYVESNTKADYVIYKTLKPSKDCTVDGEFVASGGHRMLNHSGATFDLSPYTFGEFGWKNLNGVIHEGYFLEAYNLDETKLQVIPLDATIEFVDTYTNERKPQKTQVPYYIKDGYRIAENHTNGKTFVAVKEKSGTKTTVSIPFYNRPQTPGGGLGFYATTITFRVIYDGKTIGEIKADSMRTESSNKWTVDTCKETGMSPVRAACWKIVQEAVKDNWNNGEVDYNKDVLAIKEYIYNKYKYGEDIFSDDFGKTIYSDYDEERMYVEDSNKFLFSMTCIGGALCIETYAVMVWDEYGFTTPRGSSSDYHKSFALDSDPDNYWSAQGHY